MRLIGIDHVALRVDDLAGLGRFYRDVLGCVVERERPELGMTHFRVGDALVDLIARDGPLGRTSRASAEHLVGNLDHLCFRVANFDPEIAAQAIQAAGADVVSTRSRYGATGDGISIYARDPEGNGLEFRA